MKMIGSPGLMRDDERLGEEMIDVFPQGLSLDDWNFSEDMIELA